MGVRPLSSFFMVLFSHWVMMAIKAPMKST